MLVQKRKSIGDNLWYIQVTPFETEPKTKSQIASKLAAAKLLAKTEKSLEVREVEQTDQTANEQSPDTIISGIKATQSTQEEVLAVKNSLETGQLSKLLREVRNEN